MNRALLAVVTALLAAGSARGDGAPLMPFTKNVHAIHRIETHESHPDYVFVLYREGHRYDAVRGMWDDFKEAAFVELAPDKPLVLDLAGRAPDQPADKQRALERAMLMIVPREVANSYKTARDLALTAWSRMPHGATAEWFYDRVWMRSWEDDEVTVSYRVQRNKSGDKLEVVRTSWPQSLVPWCAAVFFVPAIVLGGLWVGRWWFRRVPVQRET